MTLPGIGPAKAKAIVERREAMNGFRAIDDLLDVPGIGPKTLERLATLVRVNGAPEEKR
jgi:competence protein ComEA